jgi:3-methylfumaryl-CoA hydratase
MDMGHLKTWIGREQRICETLNPFQARALAAMLNHSRLPEAGDSLAPAWHWLYFLDTPSTAGTGTDGHPHKGGFLPPIPLPRRMWASGSVEVVQPLRLGESAEKLSKIRSVEHKSGKSGELAFVSIEHQVHQRGTLCICEEQTVVYRAQPVEPTSLPHGEPAAVAADWSRTVEPDPVLLFRFSALTYNAHRIHYDRDYATRQEFYPGLVVHAPLLVMLLLDLVLQQGLVLPVKAIRFRAVRPTVDLGPVYLRGKREGPQVTLWSADHENYLGINAIAALGEAP